MLRMNTYFGKNLYSRIADAHRVWIVAAEAVEFERNYFAYSCSCRIHFCDFFSSKADESVPSEFEYAPISSIPTF